MDEDLKEFLPKEIKHKPKRYACCSCKKQYVYVSNAHRHNRMKHEGKAQFKSLGEFRWKE